MNSARGKVFGMAMLAGALALAVTSVECASGSTTSGGTGGKTAGGSGGSSVGAGGAASVGTGGSTPGAGGTTGTGGATSGTGGSTSGSGGAMSGTGGSTMLTCASPAMIGSSGLLTDFSPAYWSNTTGKWGMAPVIGGKFSYAGPVAVDAAMSTATATVDTTAQNLNFTATVEPAGYAGVGLSFDECATVGTFNAVQFTLLGTTGGCALEVQVQTYDEKPTTQNPAGGCTANCSYRAKTNLPLPTSDTDKTTVTVGLNTTDLPGWTDIEAAQIVGLQWQVTVPAPTDGGAQTACTVDLRIDDIAFVTQ